MSFAAALEEVTRALAKEERQIPPGVAEAYIGGGRSKLRYMGLKVPQMRAVARKGFSFLSESEKEILRIWDYIWKNSPYYEVMALAIDYYAPKNRRELLPQCWPTLKTWASRLDNWAHSDGLSSIYATTLEDERKLVLPTLEKWSTSRNPWLRRQSVVSLIYYAGARERVLPFAKLKAMVERQLEHPDYYVQKGVGWTLREMGTFYPEETWKFLEKNVLSLDAAAFQAATEKLSWARKERLKEMRRAARRKS